MSKKLYNSPELTVYGTVSELTHFFGGDGGSDVLYASPDSQEVYGNFTNRGSINAVINPCIEHPGDPLCGSNQP